jgi:hypothetical protein
LAWIGFQPLEAVFALVGATVTGLALKIPTVKHLPVPSNGRPTPVTAAPSTTAALITALLSEPRDRRSIGRAEELATAITHQPQLLAAAVHAMTAPDPIGRMRAADAVEKRRPASTPAYSPRIWTICSRR